MHSRLLQSATFVLAVAMASVAAAQGVMSDTGPSPMAAMHAMHAAPGPITQHIDVPAGARSIVLPDLGVEIVSIRLSAAGSLLDLRYRVLDPAKARQLGDPSVPLLLVNPATRAELQIPVDDQVGALRQAGTHLRAGQMLASLFANPDHAIGKGGKVTLRIGGLEVSGLTVEG